MQTDNVPKPDLDSVLKDTIATVKHLRSVIIDNYPLTNGIVEGSATANLLENIDILLANLDQSLNPP